MTLDTKRIFRIRNTYFTVFVVEQDTRRVEHQIFACSASLRVLDPNMELLAVKLEKKQNGSTEVYAEKKFSVVKLYLGQ